ncbi:NAD(P)-dependent alcohol dehydrogenase [uncultured Shewanella sp.]|uniref:NADPH-dependent aldehyde reductase Ahr n=1 Tax=uncultured Shewanella sp. TaxID=173975 RepID=UPI00262F607F|nr:NAD(P)-dependent alcohol dehydrogenase [uncultured Shewanella sp.]
MINAFAAQFAKDELSPFSYDPGPLGANDVEIKVDYCGLCYSDISMIDNAWGMSQYPLVPGHEVIGKVHAKGDLVTHLALGDCVGLGWHAGYCMTCEYCLSGKHNLCALVQGTIVDHHGGFADRVRASAHSVVKLPENLQPASAGPLFCGGITVFTPLIEFNIQPTAKVAVIGIGGLGHLALQFLHAWGCEITAFTTHADKQQQALDFGAHKVISCADDNTLSKLQGQFDLILSTVNAKLNWQAYLATLKPEGRLHFVGMGLDSVSFTLPQLIPWQRMISGSPVGSPNNIRKMLDFAQQHQIEAKVEYYPFSQINEAIRKLRKGEARYRLVLTHEQVE